LGPQPAQDFKGVMAEIGRATSGAAFVKGTLKPVWEKLTPDEILELAEEFRKHWAPGDTTDNALLEYLHHAGLELPDKMFTINDKLYFGGMFERGRSPQTGTGDTTPSAPRTTETLTEEEWQSLASAPENILDFIEDMVPDEIKRVEEK